MLAAVDEWPLTPNGKTDRQALRQRAQDAEVRDEGQPYQPPADAAEQLLADVWQQVLGRQALSVEANFFQLGGDSIKAIQIASRCYRSGYHLHIRDLFAQPTIRSLAPLLTAVGQRAVSQEPLSGPAALLPMQVVFFEQQRANPHHYNQALLLRSPQGWQSKPLQGALQALLHHHDGLRLRYRHWQSPAQHVEQYFAEASAVRFSLHQQDLRSLPAADQLEALARGTDQLQQSLHLQQGPLMAAGLWHLSDGDRLLVVVHHLAVDGVSWRLLLEDLQTAYQQLLSGEALALPAKTESLQAWGKQLVHWGQQQARPAQLSYWQQVVAQGKRWAGLPPADASAQGSGGISFRLSQTQTHQLLGEVHRAYGTQINEVLLAALLLGWQEWRGQNELLIELEGHGREELNGVAHVDVSRTVGWLTSLYPVVLSTDGASDGAKQAAGVLKRVKEQLRGVPTKGLGYGVLQHMLGEEQLALTAQVLFNYLGSFDTSLDAGGVSLATESAGGLQDAAAADATAHPLSVISLVVEGQLEVGLNYRRSHLTEEQVESLADCYQQQLEGLIAHCLNQQQTELTPSDLTYESLSLSEVEGYSARYRLEDICPLTPMQQGMLFHALLTPDSAAYCTQVSYRLSGVVDGERVEAGLQELFNRYAVLRSLFVYADTDQPLRLVLSERTVDFAQVDLRGAGDVEAALSAYQAQDLRRGFDLSQDVLMRVSLLRLAEASYVLVWSNHHILMDGWCARVLVGEFVELYASGRAARAPRLGQVAPFSRYLRWLAERDSSASSAYWQSYLAGYQQACPLPQRSGGGQTGTLRSHLMRLSADQRAGLERLASGCQVTLNTVFQGLWG
ncbi:MAG: condensation domain-containing protein, partial [Rubrivirga sp.]